MHAHHHMTTSDGYLLQGAVDILSCGTCSDEVCWVGPEQTHECFGVCQVRVKSALVVLGQADNRHPIVHRCHHLVRLYMVMILQGVCV